MRIPTTFVRSYEFACYSKSCAPPPAGTGGSNKGGRAASGREGFREGSYGGRPTKTKVLGAKEAKSLRAYEARPRPHTLADVRANTTSVWKKASQGGGKATPENFPRGDGRKGAVHSTTGVTKTGVTLQKKWAAHRKEAGRQIDLRNERVGHAPGVKLPLRNATTGRLNPSPVRASFKQGMNEIIGKTPGAKRTTGDFKGLIAGKTVKVKTSNTYRGRNISHEATGGSAPRYTRAGPLVPKFVQRLPKGIKPAPTHVRTVKSQS